MNFLPFATMIILMVRRIFLHFHIGKTVLWPKGVVSEVQELLRACICAFSMQQIDPQNEPPDSTKIDEKNNYRRIELSTFSQLLLNMLPLLIFNERIRYRYWHIMDTYVETTDIVQLAHTSHDVINAITKTRAHTDF